MESSDNVRLRVAAKAVVIKDNKVLLLREASTYEEGTNLGKYQIPGGRIEADESFFDGLTREVREETGLIVKVGEPFFVGEWWPEIRGFKNHIVAMFMRCEYVSGDVHLSEEHDDFIWVGFDDLPNYKLTPPDDEVIRKALL